MSDIYLDHAAATSLDPQVEKAMKPFAREFFGNPGSFHTPGLRAKEASDDARKRIAVILGCQPVEILFTSGGTESDNLAVQGIPRFYAKKLKGPLSQKESDPVRAHVVTSSIEHPAVLEPLTKMEKRGEIDLTILNVNRDGRIDPKTVVSALRDNTVLVTIMYANNEIGTIQPIAEIGRELLKWRKEKKTAFPYFHTDACQASGALDLSVEKLHVDAMTINAS
ncbi:MAG: aminotransferase class V-fold PLP-dependent enzyme, partial [bacterium]|nr:aminotransferase class V-fold PLP-dependent enzyme [bacterium]